MILRIGSGPRSDQPKEEEMGRVIVTEFVSLDGVMEAPGGEPGYAHSGWTFDFGDAGQYAYKLDETLEAEALLLGRVTYEGFAAAWPGRTDEAGFADKMNEMPKYVVSSTLDEVNWNNSTLLRVTSPTKCLGSRKRSTESSSWPGAGRSFTGCWSTASSTSFG
jgi:dihydrofolate reductase